MPEELRSYILDEAYSMGYVITSDTAIKNLNVVAVILVNEAGLTIYRHRKDITPEQLIEATKDTSLPILYQIFDIIE